MEQNQEQETEQEIETEVESMEILLNSEEIDELIGKLNELKQNKQPVHFEINDKNEMIIHFDDGAPLGVPSDSEFKGKEEEEGE